MSEWIEYKISDIADVIGGGTPKTSIEEYWNGNIPWLSVVDFNTGKKYVSSTEKSITSLGLEKSSTKLLVQNDIIISARGTVGALAMLDKPMTFNQSCYGMRAKENTTSDYLFYLLKNTVRHLQQASYGAVFDTITRNTFDETYISLPPLEEQKAIAEVLSSLDDKIDLLHRQNKTLEEMAQTLFRQWFVEEADERWEEKPLKDICTIINGFAFKSGDYRDSGRMVIRTMNFENGFVDTSNVVYIDVEEEVKYTRQQLQKNDFLLVMVGASLGKFAIVTSDILPTLQNQNMWNFRSLGNISQHYLNFALRQIIEDNRSSASGSAREFFQKGQFYEFLITVPDNEKMLKFENYAEDFYSKIEKNRIQIKTLENMRDTLLPKLMSGEVRVSMSNLQFAEKQLFEKIFEMGSGYLLDFSNASLQEFMNDFEIDLGSHKYDKYGSSKAKRFRAFWEVEDDVLVANVLQSLLDLAISIREIDSKDIKLAQKYIRKLQGGQSVETTVKTELTEVDFLKQEFSKIDISKLSLDSSLEKVIRQRLDEIKKSLHGEASLSVIFLCGSTLEGLLLHVATLNPKKFNTSKSAPKYTDGKVKQLHEWTLDNLINVAYEEDFIKLDIKKFSHTLKDFRNYIHPRQQASQNFNPDKHTAEISWKVLQATIANLSGDRV